MRYLVIVQHMPAGGCVAWLPDLPGVTANGGDRDEALATLEQAALAYVQERRAAGLPLPTPAARRDAELPEGSTID